MRTVDKFAKKKMGKKIKNYKYFVFFLVCRSYDLVAQYAQHWLKLIWNRFRHIWMFWRLQIDVNITNIHVAVYLYLFDFLFICLFWLFFFFLTANYAWSTSLLICLAFASSSKKERSILHYTYDSFSCELQTCSNKNNNYFFVFCSFFRSLLLVRVISFRFVPFFPLLCTLSLSASRNLTHTNNRNGNTERQ